MGLLHDCDLFANLRLTFVSSSNRNSGPHCNYLVRCQRPGLGSGFLLALLGAGVTALLSIEPGGHLLIFM